MSDDHESIKDLLASVLNDDPPEKDVRAVEDIAKTFKATANRALESHAIDSMDPEGLEVMNKGGDMLEHIIGKVTTEPTAGEKDALIAAVDEVGEALSPDDILRNIVTGPDPMVGQQPGEPDDNDLEQADAGAGLAEAGGSEPDMQDIPRRKSIMTGQDVVLPPIPTFTNEEIAETLDIRNFGTLVTLETKRWHAKVKDNEAAKAAADTSGATQEAYTAYKKLLAGADEKLLRIHKILDSARTRHYQMTLPWCTTSAGQGKRKGSRLLPNTLFMEYAQEMATFKADMDKAVRDFEALYPTLINIAKQKLDTAFKQEEYPPVSAIAAHFGLVFDFLPIPLGGDFQGLADAQVSALSDKLQSKTETMVENAMGDAWMRLLKVVTHAAEKLNNPDMMFHYTMVDKLRDCTKMLKHLNITGDARVEDVRAFVEKNLTMHEAKEVRKDDALRRRLGKLAKEAVAMMEVKDEN